MEHVDRPWEHPQIALLISLFNGKIVDMKSVGVEVKGNVNNVQFGEQIHG